MTGDTTSGPGLYGQLLGAVPSLGGYFVRGIVVMACSMYPTAHGIAGLGRPRSDGERAAGGGALLQATERMLDADADVTIRHPGGTRCPDVARARGSAARPNPIHRDAATIPTAPGGEAGWRFAFEPGQLEQDDLAWG